MTQLYEINDNEFTFKETEKDSSEIVLKPASEVNYEKAFNEALNTIAETGSDEEKALLNDNSFRELVKSKVGLQDIIDFYDNKLNVPQDMKNIELSEYNNLEKSVLEKFVDLLQRDSERHRKADPGEFKFKRHSAPDEPEDIFPAYAERVYYDGKHMSKMEYQILAHEKHQAFLNEIEGKNKELDEKKPALEAEHAKKVEDYKRGIVAYDMAIKVVQQFQQKYRELNSFNDLMDKLPSLFQRIGMTEAEKNHWIAIVTNINMLTDANRQPLKDQAKILEFAKRLIPEYGKIVHSGNVVAISELHTFFLFNLGINLPTRLERGEFLNYSSLLYDTKSDEGKRSDRIKPEFAALTNQNLNKLTAKYTDDADSRREKLSHLINAYVVQRNLEGDGIFGNFFKPRYLYGKEKIRLGKSILAKLDAKDTASFYSDTEIQTMTNGRMGARIEKFYLEEAKILQNNPEMKSVLPAQLKDYYDKKHNPQNVVAPPKPISK